MANKKKAMPKAKEPVRIRFKPLKGTDKAKPIKEGNRSIYFDIYRNGKRVYDFPKMYLVPEISEMEKEMNREVLFRAEMMKNDMIKDILTNESGISLDGLKQKANFIEYIRQLSDKKQKEYIKNKQNRTNTKIDPKRGVRHNYMGLIMHLIKYKGDKITFKHVTKEYVAGFNEYLKTAENGSYKPGISEINLTGFLS